MTDAAFDADVARASAIYETLGPWIDRYHGGVPVGFVASAILHESGGDFGAPGDASLGEVGYLQVAAYVPPLFGYPPEARADPESNIAIGILEYELEAVLWSISYPEVALGTDDSWKLARLAFAIGRGGSHQLADMARAAGGLDDGAVYNSIVRYILANGGVPLGSQSADKVAQRVIDIDRQWAIGQAIGGTSGPPMIIPDPPAGPYTLPAEVAPFFVAPLSTATLLLLGGAGVLLYMILKRR